MICEATGNSVESIRLTASETKSRLVDCDRLPSLSSINIALQRLLSREDSSTQDISAMVRNDPSLMARILRLTNSAFYGLSGSVKNVDEAVFYLGVAQIQRLVLASPIIDHFDGIAEGVQFSWKEFWKHSVSVAMITQELVDNGDSMYGDDSAYLAGLMHDVGKIAIAVAFPETFIEIQTILKDSRADLTELEVDFLGMDHAEIGAFYFDAHKMPEVLIETTRYHHLPESAEGGQRIAAAVRVADLATRSANIGCGGNTKPVETKEWKELDSWDFLVPEADPRSIEKAQRKVDKLLISIPQMVGHLV
jgi:putative nucleotidyltransferase with HDIG domain